MTFQKLSFDMPTFIKREMESNYTTNEHTHDAFFLVRIYIMEYDPLNLFSVVCLEIFGFEKLNLISFYRTCKDTQEVR